MSSDVPPASTESKALPRSPMGRRAMAILATIFTGMVIVRGAGAIHRETFGAPPGRSTDARCSDGIARLYEAYNPVWDARREDPSRALPPELDLDLRRLGPVCEAEGPEAAQAFEALERWRYRAEALSRRWHDTLRNDAALARAYHSPGTSR